MAQTGYTPIQIYYSTTPTNQPSAGNLIDGELAINTADGKLYYKDGVTVKLLASNASSTGTVSTVSVVSTNGFAGTVANATTTPAITLTTTITGVLKGDGTAISAATAGTDYAPATSGTSILYGNGSGGFSNVTVSTGLSFVGGTLTATGGSSSFSSISSISGNTNASTTVLYVMTANLTLTLPASPATGDYVGVSNRSGTTTCVISRNGNNIMGTAENMTVDVLDAGFTLFYSGATNGWVIL
jgi:hypothetical protein